MDEQKNILLQATQQDTGVQLQKKSRAAIVSFVSGNMVLFGLFGGVFEPFLTYFFLAFPVAIVAGHLGRKRLRQNPEKWAGEGMAVYGLVLGYLGLGLSLFLVVMMTMGYGPGN